MILTLFFCMELSSDCLRNAAFGNWSWLRVGKQMLLHTTKRREIQIFVKPIELAVLDMHRDAYWYRSRYEAHRQWPRTPAARPLACDPLRACAGISGPADACAPEPAARSCPTMRPPPSTT